MDHVNKLKLVSEAGLPNGFSGIVKEPTVLKDAIMLALRGQMVTGYAFHQYQFDLFTYDRQHSDLKDAGLTRCDFGMPMDLEFGYQVVLNWLQNHSRWPEEKYDGDGHNSKSWTLVYEPMGMQRNCRISTSWTYYGK